MQLNQAISRRLSELLHELCQGLGIDLPVFFASPLFREDNLEP